MLEPSDAGSEFFSNNEKNTNTYNIQW